LNASSQQIYSVELCIRPQSHVIDQSFRFHQSENEFLKTTIRLQHTRSDESLAFALPTHHLSSTATGAQSVRVRTSDPDAIAGVHEQRRPMDPIEVSIKYKCTISPSASRFFVLVYDDAWLHQLLATWEIIVHSLQRIDLHALVGQTSLAKANLRGGSHSMQGPVQCFSSVPSELSLFPAAPFTMMQDTLHEVVLHLRPLSAGRKQYIVHAVDLSHRTLLSAWLIHAASRCPAVTKAFSLTIDPLHGANKRVSFGNPYSYDATFHVFTDQSHLLQVKQRCLRIPAGEARHIHLKFREVLNAIHPVAKLLVFINNEDDKNEECMQITLHYATGN